MQILDGKKASLLIKNELRREIQLNHLKLKVLFIQIGNHKPSARYISLKMKMAEDLRIEADWKKWSKNVDSKKLFNEVENLVSNYDGIVVQLPLPNHINKEDFLNLIPPSKDIDGLTKKSFFLPATPLGVIKLLDHYKLNYMKKKVAIIGTSKLVGEPLKKKFDDLNVDVKAYNLDTGIKNLDQADLIISAAGSPNLIKGNMIKQNAILVDVGFTVEKINGKEVVLGDIDFESVSQKASFLSPVPGGVGPMTVVSLFSNLINFKLTHKH